MYKLLIAVFFAFGFTGCYYVDQGQGQLKLRFDQVPLAQAIQAEPDPHIRFLLAQVPKIKTFGQEVLGLSTNQNYQGYYATNQKGITYVVTGSSKLKLEAYTWWFPVVGTVPYKGFFNPQDAEALKNQLETQGYDVYVFAAPAYSSLGWFKDPITTPMLHSGLFGLAETILHEMAHATLYIEGQGDFNEQLASFVGVKGAKLFVTQKAGWQKNTLDKLRQQQALSRQAQALIHQTVPQFQQLYQNPALDRQTKLNLKTQRFRALETKLKKLTGYDWKLNNARLLQFRRYQADNPIFKQTLDQAKGNWPTFWKLTRQYTKAKGW